jgi:hypothetical protein
MFVSGNRMRGRKRFCFSCVEVYDSLFNVAKSLEQIPAFKKRNGTNTGLRWRNRRNPGVRGRNEGMTGSRERNEEISGFRYFKCTSLGFHLLLLQELEEEREQEEKEFRFFQHFKA